MRRGIGARRSVSLEFDSASQVSIPVIRADLLGA